LGKDVHVFTVHNGKIIEAIPGQTPKDSLLFIPVKKGSSEILKEQREKIKLDLDLIRMRFKAASKRAK
jgi:thioredoxin-related protein